MAAGLRVIRGPGWTLGDADGGEGHVGTVSAAKPDGTADVIWDGGKQTTVPSKALRVLDNAPVGIRHTGVTCNACHEGNLVGMRWKCGQCHDYELCSPCYFTDCHDTTHQFLRYETPATSPVKMDVRSTSLQIGVLGIFPEASVVRGKDWQWGNQDGGAGTKGVVLDLLTPDQDSARSTVKVEWSGGGSNVYRLGYKGKVDLKYTEQSPGGQCYRDHLPVFDANSYKQTALMVRETTLDEVISSGDRVYLDLDPAKKQELRNSGNTVGEILDKVGQVEGTMIGGNAVVAFGPRKFQLSQSILKKVPKFKLGDRVQVLTDEKKVAAFQDGHGGYNRHMRASLGKVGQVVKVDSDGDVVVQFEGCKWCYNPACLTPAAGRSLDTVASRVSGGGDDDSSDDEGESGLNLLGHLIGAIALAAAVEGVGKNIFLKAIVEGDDNAVRQLLQRDPALIRVVEQGVGALHIAANLGHSQITQILVEKGAPINQRDKDGDTPLNAGMKHDAIADYLIKKGADVTIANNQSRTPSHNAALYGHAHILRLLMHHGADFNAVDKEGDTPLHDSIHQGRTAAAEVLIGWPKADLRRKNKKGFTPLQFAAFKGHASIADVLVQKDRTLVNEQKEDGYTALHVAAVNNHTDVMKVLLAKGKANVEIRTQKRQTPLHVAAQEAHMDAVQMLIAHGADVNAKDGNGDRPLHILLSSHVGPLQGGDLFLLLLVGQAPKVKEEERVRIACYMLQAGADADARNNNGKTAVDECPSAQIAEAVKRFLRDK